MAAPALALTLLLTVTVGDAAAGAQGAGAALPAEAVGRLSPELAGLVLQGEGFEAAVDELHDAERASATARRQAAAAEARAGELARAEAEVAARRQRWAAEEQAQAAALDAARARLAEVAVAAYITGAETARVSALLDARSAADLERRTHLIDVVRQHERSAAEVYLEARDRAAGEVADALDELDTTRRARERSQRAASAADAEGSRLEARLPALRSAVAARAPLAAVAGTDLPVVALDAYWRAARATARAAPGCGLRWTAVAGIGRIESWHGTYRGRRPTGDGTVAPPIVGIPLDGTRATRRVADTDRGRIDGDASFDRAVGPLQFIPATWAAFGGDGNGDGRADPHNLYDAARATARYLCRAVPTGLGSTEALRRAFYAYNHSDAYAADVLSWARRYDGLAVSP